MQIGGDCQVAREGSKVDLESEALAAVPKWLVYFMRWIGLSGFLVAGVDILAIS